MIVKFLHILFDLNCRLEPLFYYLPIMFCYIVLFNDIGSIEYKCITIRIKLEANFPLHDNIICLQKTKRPQDEH